jgi:hypothetical protein
MASTEIPSRVCFPYYLTRDINLDIKVKVSRAEGLIPRALTVGAVIKSGQRALNQSSKDTSLPASVFPYVSWDEWLVFPVRYSDLASDAELEFTFRDHGCAPVYRAALELFETDHRVLRVGTQRVRIRTLAAHAQHRRAAAAKALEEDDDDFATVDRAGVAAAAAAAAGGDAAETDAFRLLKLREKRARGGPDAFALPWLDRLVEERFEVGGQLVMQLA